MRNLVAQLYGGSWRRSVQKAAELVQAEEAEQVVQDLTRSSGWRERVVAAKLVSAFGLRHCVAPLVRTFAAGPENYTAIAFATLLAEVDVPDKDQLLGQLRAACPDSSYGKHLLEVIQNASAASPES
ncbi:hypothetical protein IHE49_14925 [Rhodanobacter sp. 7MK24]|uniref:hypothetical protein n=1 Tax=Rhodanobacter sp. 7MK24 TaxID=2775922 RepID=UPI001780B781|nr:hypothetical protein [Rhodanobacter sp. 7MK24]MBD8881778.1 hypothetical protein [Rhodanobacter sp. 7MK24]